MSMTERCQPLAVLTAVALASSVLPSVARATDCETQIAAVQSAGDGDLQVFFSNSWHLIAAANHPGLKDRFSIILTAFLAARDLVLQYPDGYACDVTEYGTEAIAVRIK